MTPKESQILTATATTAMTWPASGCTVEAWQPAASAVATTAAAAVAEAGPTTQGPCC